MFLIGSRALKHHYSNAREPKDYDFIATEKEVDQFLSRYQYKDTSKHYKKRRALIDVNGKKISFEFDLVERSPSSKLIYNNSNSKIVEDTLLQLDLRIATPETLFFIKKSHITFPIHWWKNIYDYHFLWDKLKDKDYPEWNGQILNIRYQEIRNRFNKKEIDFNLSNQEFFKKSEEKVKRFVDHDSLHWAIKFYDEPLFLEAKDDPDRAELSSGAVLEMTDEHKIQMIQEEVMALSLEREIIPALIKKEKYDANLSYARYAGKMVYHYLPEWLRFFAADNFLDILDVKKNYVQECLTNHPTLNKII